MNPFRLNKLEWSFLAILLVVTSGSIFKLPIFPWYLNAIGEIILILAILIFLAASGIMSALYLVREIRKLNGKH